jgi:hypothetical protein
MKKRGWKRCIKDCSTISDYSKLMGLTTVCKKGKDYFVVEDYYNFVVIFSPGDFSSFPRENFCELVDLRSIRLKELGI